MFLLGIFFALVVLHWLPSMKDEGLSTNTFLALFLSLTFQFCLSYCHFVTSQLSLVSKTPSTILSWNYLGMDSTHTRPPSDQDFSSSELLSHYLNGFIPELTVLKESWLLPDVLQSKDDFEEHILSDFSHCSVKFLH